MKTERRTRRSENPIEAAHLYLKSAAERRSFCALALVDDDGSLVANAPSNLNSEALAAVAPFVREADQINDGLLSLVTRGKPYRVWDIQVDGSQHYLTAVGGDASRPDEAETALARIFG